MKSDVERGPFGAWAFHARDLLDISVESVAEQLGYHPASLRKMESGSVKPASRRMQREVPDLYSRLAKEKGLTLPPVPVLSEEAQDQSALIAAIDRQTAAITALVDEIRADRSRLSPESVTEFLRELASEGLLLVGDRETSTSEPQKQGAGR